MTCLPAVEPVEGLLAGLRSRDLDHRDVGAAAPGRRRPGRDRRARGRGRSAALRLRREAALHGRPTLLPLCLGFRGRILIGGAALPRWLHPRWLALLLAVVRWP